MKLIEATMSPEWVIALGLHTVSRLTPDVCSGARSATEFFHELPDKNEYADYYQFIQNPISLAEITVGLRHVMSATCVDQYLQAKMQQRSYSDIDQWMRDVDLMCDNAMQYNMEGSGIYQDAQAIKVRNDIFVCQYCADTNALSVQSELNRVRLAFQQASREQDADVQSTSNSTPAPGSSSGPKLKLNLSGPKERSSAASVARPIKDKVIRVKRPALPEKQVSKEIVASLSQYDESERAAWSATLNAKQTKELIQLMKEQDELEPSKPSIEEASAPIPKAGSRGAGLADNSKPQTSIPSGTEPSKAHVTTQQRPGHLAKQSPSVTPTAPVPVTTSKTTPKSATLPSPSAPPPPPPITHPAANQIHGQSRIVPYTAPSGLQHTSTPTSLTLKSMSNPGRPTASPLYASYTIPAPIPRPQPQALPKIYLPAQPAPLLPLIRHFSFTYDLLAPPVDPRQPTHRTELQNTIKLRNMRGITSHIVAIDRATRNIEVTAFLEEGYYNLNPLILNERSEPIGHNDQAPLVDTLSYAPLPELSLECNGKTPNGELVHPGGDVTKRPIAHKWSFPVDLAIVNFVVEVHVHRPAEQVEDGRKELKETSMIFVNRQ